ncbi:hypothetical protein B0H63DRAFT_446083 [Podospora didyma]|uniref:Uncharacterized protein n=1 Tax=Podospora didyma TaxID=330526 RepID=A0AAE0NYE5_9PEZI|nr:hypothetical protein B0H63DRAFT_446083 [Podospora didyma]
MGPNDSDTIANEHTRFVDERVVEEFHKLRGMIFRLVTSRPPSKPPTWANADQAPVYSPSEWIYLTVRQREFRIMGGIFDLLFTRILSPHRQLFFMAPYRSLFDTPNLRIDYNHRSNHFEKELRRQGVPDRIITQWDLMGFLGPVVSTSKKPITGTAVPTNAIAEDDGLARKTDRALEHIVQKAHMLKHLLQCSGERWRIEMPVYSANERRQYLPADEDAIYLDPQNWLLCKDYQTDRTKENTLIQSVPFGALTKL